MSKVDKLQEYLRKNGPEKLDQEFSIAVKQHGTYPNLYLFKYSQIDSPMHEEIVQVCRGIILDRDNDWKVVSYTYDKFFNAGESLAAKIDWSTAKVYEKLDGSLCQLYWYDNQWHVATSGTPDASGEVNGYGISFKDLFWKVWNELGYKFPETTNICYAFELCTPYNRVVVPYKKNRIVLHGARGISSLKEKNELFRYANEHGWELIKILSYENYQEEIDVLKLADKLDPMQTEGFVVCDHNFRRVKIKSPKYVALHHAVDGMTPRRMLEIIQKNESDEFLSYFEEFRALYETIKEKYNRLVLETEETYNKFKHIENQKEFALSVKDLSCAGACFSIRSKKYKTFLEYYNNMNVKYLEEILQLKELV
jgi:hypothetical protein